MQQNVKEEKKKQQLESKRRQRPGQVAWPLSVLVSSSVEEGMRPALGRTALNEMRCIKHRAPCREHCGYGTCWLSLSCPASETSSSESQTHFRRAELKNWEMSSQGGWRAVLSGSPGQLRSKGGAATKFLRTAETAGSRWAPV